MIEPEVLPRVPIEPETPERPRAEIIGRMLGNRDDFSLDGLCAVLNVYYWWDDDWIDPVGGLEDVMKDMLPAQVAQTLRVMHAAFPDFCVRADENDELPCQKPDGWECFLKIGRDSNGYSYYSESDSLEVMLDDDDGPMIDYLFAYNRRKLGEAGLNEIKCDYIKEAYMIEQDVPNFGWRVAYPFPEHMKAGGTIEEYIHRYFPAGQH